MEANKIVTISVRLVVDKSVTSIFAVALSLVNVVWNRLQNHESLSMGKKFLSVQFPLKIRTGGI